MPQRAVAQRAVFLDLSVKGERADSGGRIPHPCADAVAAGSSVLPGFQRQAKLAAAPADGEGHGPAAALVDQRRQLLDAVQGLAVDLGDHVPGFQPCQPRRAESAGQVAGAHHQYTLRLQGHAHGLPARVQAQIVPNLHRDLTQGQKPQQTDGGPGLRATVQRVAGGGKRLHVRLVRRQPQGKGKLRRRFLPGGNDQTLRQMPQRFRLGRIKAQQPKGA